MLCCSRPAGVLRSLVRLALLGFAVTVLIGPALAVLGVLLPFALIGALAWACYRLGRALVRRVLLRRTRHVMIDTPPAYRAEMVDYASAVEPVVDAEPFMAAPSRVRSLVRSGAQLAIEVGCGAALGAALSGLVVWQNGTGIEQVFLGGAIGAVVGFVVGGSRSGQAATEANRSVASSAA